MSLDGNGGGEGAVGFGGVVAIGEEGTGLVLDLDHDDRAGVAVEEFEMFHECAEGVGVGLLVLFAQG